MSFMLLIFLREPIKYQHSPHQLIIIFKTSEFLLLNMYLDV